MSPEGHIREIDRGDVNNLSLELMSLPVCNRLVVFIQDPDERRFYWHRRISIEWGSTTIGGKRISYLDMTRYPIEPHDSVPVVEENLPIVLDHIASEERKIRDYPTGKDLWAVVGVTRYNGDNPQTVDTLLELTRVKYGEMYAAQRS